MCPSTNSVNGGPHSGNSALPEPLSGYYGIKRGYCLSRPIPSLCIDGAGSSTKPQGKTFVFEGSGFAEGAPVQQWIRSPSGNQNPLNTLKVDSYGNINWSFSSNCKTAPGTYTVWVIEQTTGRCSNDVTETVAPGNCKQRHLPKSPGGFQSLVRDSLFVHQINPCAASVPTALVMENKTDIVSAPLKQKSDVLRRERSYIL